MPRIRLGIVACFTFLGLVSLLVGCSSEPTGTFTPDQTEPSFLTALGPAVCVPLIAGRTIAAGQVCVSNDDDEFGVQYTTTGGWTIVETHLAVALTVGGIPQNRNGNPTPAKFPFSQTPSPGASEVTHTIGFSGAGLQAGDRIFVAANALLRNGTRKEDAWGAGIQFPGASWATYFRHFTIGGTLALVGGTYTDATAGVIGTGFAMNPVVSAGTVPFADISGPPSWNGGSTLRCFTAIFQGGAADRSVCWRFVAPLTGRYQATAAVGGTTYDTRFFVDPTLTLTPPEITNVSVAAGQVTIDWTASPEAQSFLVRVNPLPFTGVTAETVVSGSTRSWTFSGLSLASGAQYQAVVFAFSLDLKTPGDLRAPFNIGAHGITFTAP